MKPLEIDYVKLNRKNEIVFYGVQKFTSEAKCLAFLRNLKKISGNEDGKLTVNIKPMKP